MAKRKAAPKAAPLVIAIDGPAAAGKGTLARKLAAHYGLNYLDSGSLYRAVAQAVLNAGGDPANPEDAIPAALALDPESLADPGLRAERVAEAASEVAAIPGVRKALLAFQRKVAATPPGAVIDGRDIGTVVCPGAPVKLYLEADLKTRALRRLKELQERGAESIEERVLQEMRDRDRRDSRRETSPLAAAPDALCIDTTKLDADAVFEAALSFVEEKIARLRGEARKEA